MTKITGLSVTIGRAAPLIFYNFQYILGAAEKRGYSDFSRD
jgi:hypothetical protein